jgi:hypothetical protein
LISSWAADRKADSVGTAELVSMVEGYSRSSSRPSAKRSSTLTEACGWRIKRTSCIQILTLMPLNVSFYITLCFIRYLPEDGNRA